MRLREAAKVGRAARSPMSPMLPCSPNCGGDRTVSVLHVVAPAAFGGLEAVVQSLAIGALGSPVQARVAAVIPPSQPEHPFLGPLREAGVEVFEVAPPARSYLQERAAMTALCRRLRPDVVHTHGYRPDVVDAGVARRLGVPVVTTVHGFTGGGWKNRLYEALQRRAFRRFDAVVAVCRPLANTLAHEGVPVDRLHLVPNAWIGAARPLERAAARCALGVPQEGQRIGWVGRLSHEKGPDVLLAALPLLADLPVAVSLLGVGKAEAACRRQAVALGVAHRVTWHGAVPDAGCLFAAFDVFVLSSRAEGTPIALFEAMASHVPIVATAVGGVPDVVSATEARLVAPEDPAALAGAIADVLGSPARARVRAGAARAKLEREFDPEPWLRRYHAIYRGVCRAAPAPRLA